MTPSFDISQWITHLLSHHYSIFFFIYALIRLILLKRSFIHLFTFTSTIDISLTGRFFPEYIWEWRSLKCGLIVTKGMQPASAEIKTHRIISIYHTENHYTTSHRGEMKSEIKIRRLFSVNQATDSSKH